MIKKKPPLIRLFSDYEESMDFYFAKPWDKADFTFFRVSRRSKPEIGRRELFSFLEKRGIECVPHGEVHQLIERYPDDHFVVYTDENEHGGKGKELLSAEDAYKKHPNAYASVFTDTPGESVRHFQFGEYGFEMPFVSKNDWRSNVGTIRSWTRGLSRFNLLEKIGTPYFAIDFTPTKLLATDFQFAPGTKNDGLDTFLSPRDMNMSIRGAVASLFEKGILLGDEKGMYGVVEGDREPKWSGDDYFWLRYK